MRRAAYLLIFCVLGCVGPGESGIAGYGQKNGRINIRFCKNAPKAEKEIFFARHELKPVAYNIFGYDVAEWYGAPPVLKKPLSPEVPSCASKNSPDEMLVRSYEIETRRLSKSIIVKNETAKKDTPAAAGARADPWFEQFIKSEKAHKFLKDKKIPLWPNGIIFADDKINFIHQDIKPVLKYGEDGKPIFWMNPKNKLSDYTGQHNTFISCLAAGYRNGKGVDGIAADNAYILPLLLRFDLFDGSFSSDVAIGLAYFQELEKERKIDFHVVNMSFNLNHDSDILRAAIENMKDKIFVAAAANIEKGIAKNIDNDKVFPASWNLPNVIAVGATNKMDEFAVNLSNFGPGTVKIAAPGISIVGCAQNGGYRMTSGTSLSTAIVSGTISLLYSIDPFMDVENAEYALFLGAVPKYEMKDKVHGGRRLNVYASARIVYNLMYGFYDK